MKKTFRSILALILVISMLAISLLAVPAYASKPDIVENADLERTPIEYETIFEYDGTVHENPGMGLTILSDFEAANILARINGDGDLSFGRIGEDHDIDLENYSIVYLRISEGADLYWNTVIFEVSITTDGDIVVDVREVGDEGEDNLASDTIVYHNLFFVVKKSDIELLNEESKAYIGYLAPSDTFWKKTIRLPVEGEFRFGEPIIELPPNDLTGDGAFDAGDLTRLMRVIAGDEEATVAQSADINGDGAVNTKDLTRLMKFLAGRDVELA